MPGAISTLREAVRDAARGHRGPLALAAVAGSAVGLVGSVALTPSADEGLPPVAAPEPTVTVTAPGSQRSTASPDPKPSPRPSARPERPSEDTGSTGARLILADRPQQRRIDRVRDDSQPPPASDGQASPGEGPTPAPPAPPRDDGGAAPPPPADGPDAPSPTPPPPEDDTGGAEPARQLVDVCLADVACLDADVDAPLLGDLTP